MRRSQFLAALAAISLIPAHTSAMSWCANPLIVHEWGVHVFNAQGGTRSGVSPILPSYFHHAPTRSQAVGGPVRDMPADSGTRFLPVLHFYSPRGMGSGPIPFGLEVGVPHGHATHWYPQVDAQRSATQANSAQAADARRALLAARSERQPPVFGVGGWPSVGSDPTRQLIWDHLSLTDSPLHSPADEHVPWVDQVRAFDSALWVNTLHQSERFVFYEGDTSEQAPIVITRGPSDAPGHRHLILRNQSADEVHDVLFLHQEESAQFGFLVPAIPAGQSAAFVLEEHPIAELQAMRATWRARLIDTHEPSPPTEASWNPCEMTRDPAIPVETASGHALYAHEVDAILDAWDARFFGAGTRIVYRESVSTLDREMPLSLYTDMYHHIVLRRLGLGLIDEVTF